MEGKREKLARIKTIIKDGLAYRETDEHLDFLVDELRLEFNIVATDNVSSHGYDRFALELINNFPDGLILDAGAGKRQVYYPNVVNYEIAPYDTTDVLGVGEVLPFRDNSFDAAFSLAVLEHVKDPFRCAQEISRVLKPGGKLYCVVPFLQPLHAYPHHYYNMSIQGLKNLFADDLHIDDQQIIASGRPIFTLTWFLNSWQTGLNAADREQFLNMKVGDLLGSPVDYFEYGFVKNLPREKNIELACTTALFATKPTPAD